MQEVVREVPTGSCFTVAFDQQQTVAVIIKKLILIFAAVCLAACTEKTDSPEVSDPSVSYKIDDFEGAPAGDADAELLRARPGGARASW